MFIKKKSNFKDFAVIIIVVIVFVFVIIKLSKGVGSFFGEIGSKKNVFQKFKVKNEKTDGVYHVTFKDVVTSMGNMNEKVYVRADISVELKDRQVAERMGKTNKHAVAAISRVLSEFKTDEIRTPEGKEYLKRKIHEELKKLYGVEGEFNVYLSNFVFK